MKRKNKVTYLGFIIMILLIGIGYALLTTNLNITGTTVLKDNRWDIHFENVNVITGSVTASTPSIDQSGTTVSYSVTLDKPGDFFEFTVDAVNDGTLDGMIESFTSKLNGTVITTLPNALEYSVTYADGVAIANNQILEADSFESIRIRVGYKTDIEISDLPSTEQTLNLLFTMTYVQADNTAQTVPHPRSFASDSWETIVTAIRNNNTSVYHVGDTKEIELGNNLGTHTLRIANMSSPSECSTTGFSQTACGFVLEFVDIITTYYMNSEETNIGGWPASAMRTYVNTDIYNALPLDLKNSIIDTTVVSGHGNTGETNFTSIDKLYLLSVHEVWEDDDGNIGSGMDNIDTTYYNTRQLDYYTGLNVTRSSYSGAIKRQNGSNYSWGLRTAYSNSLYAFFIVTDSGSWDYEYPPNHVGVSPVFRIA